ncbi:MAG: hypothetical protein ACRDOM_11250 [Nocardioides sp.]
MDMATVVIPLVIVLVVLAAGAYAVVRFSQREQRHESELIGSEDPDLRYLLPEGQDPAAVLAALRREGFDATPVPGTTGQEVLVACPDGADRHRARIRAVIQHATTLEGGDEYSVPPVRFADEEHH